MKLTAILIAVFFLNACEAQEAEAESTAFPYFSEEGGRVRDNANLLSEAFEARLIARLDAAQERYGQQMAVVTVPSLNGYSIDDFSLAYANAWRLGNAKRNDGIMMLVAPNEREVRIEIGLGLEANFPDDFCKEMLDSQILPAFKAGEYEKGIASGTSALIERMRAYHSMPTNDNDARSTRTKDAA